GGPARLDFGIPDSLSLAEALQDFTVFETRALDVHPAWDAISNAFSGEGNVITDAYGQNLSASFQPRLDGYRWLSWFRPQPLTYSTQFSWAYTPLQGLPEDTTAAAVRTQTTLRGGIQLRPRELWRLFPFYRRIEEAAEAAAAPGGQQQPPADPGRPRAAPLPRRPRHRGLHGHLQRDAERLGRRPPRRGVLPPRRPHRRGPPPRVPPRHRPPPRPRPPPRRREPPVPGQPRR